MAMDVLSSAIPSLTFVVKQIDRDDRSMNSGLHAVLSLPQEITSLKSYLGDIEVILPYFEKPLGFPHTTAIYLFIFKKIFVSRGDGGSPE